MDYIVVEGVRPYDGRYEFDLAGQELTTREWGWIKRLSGYLPLTVEEGLSDPELIVVFAVIALRRAGKVEREGRARASSSALSDAPFGAAITMETDASDEVEEETAKRSPPPASSTSSGDTSGPASRGVRRHRRSPRESLGRPARLLRYPPRRGRRVDAGAAARLRRPLLGDARERRVVAGARGEIVVERLKELNRTFQDAPKDVRLAYREGAADGRPAGALDRGAAGRSSGSARSAPSGRGSGSGSRRRLVYVAPRERGRQGRAAIAAPARTSGLCWPREVTDPALEQNQHRIEQDFDDMLDRLVAKWDHEGRCRWPRARRSHRRRRQLARPGLQEGARSAKTFDRSMRGTTRLGQGLRSCSLDAGVSAALLGGAGLVVALRAVVRRDGGDAEGGRADERGHQVDGRRSRRLRRRTWTSWRLRCSNLSGVDDELIASAENVLLTFTNIRNVVGEGNDIFDQATLAALDMSTALGTDLTELGDPDRQGASGSDPGLDRAPSSRRPVHEGAGEDRSRRWSSRAGRSRRRRSSSRELQSRDRRRREGGREHPGREAGQAARDRAQPRRGALAATLLPVLDAARGQAGCLAREHGEPAGR